MKSFLISALVAATLFIGQTSTAWALEAKDNQNFANINSAESQDEATDAYGKMMKACGNFPDADKQKCKDDTNLTFKAKLAALKNRPSYAACYGQQSWVEKGKVGDNCKCSAGTKEVKATIAGKKNVPACEAVAVAGCFAKNGEDPAVACPCKDPATPSLNKEKWVCEACADKTIWVALTHSCQPCAEGTEWDSATKSCKPIVVKPPVIATLTQADCEKEGKDLEDGKCVPKSWSTLTKVVIGLVGLLVAALVVILIIRMRRKEEVKCAKGCINQATGQVSMGIPGEKCAICGKPFPQPQPPSPPSAPTTPKAQAPKSESGKVEDEEVTRGMLYDILAKAMSDNNDKLRESLKMEKSGNSAALLLVMIRYLKNIPKSKCNPVLKDPNREAAIQMLADFLEILLAALGDIEKEKLDQLDQ